MDDNKWEVTTERFVLFFDILGFKDLVQRETHEEVLDKLKKLKEDMRFMTNFIDSDLGKKAKFDKEQIKSATFSDSIIFFSKGNSYHDAAAMIFAGLFFSAKAFSNAIPLKGAMSYGKITVDFNENIFFGQPIIDAFVLHEELQLLCVVADHHFERQYNYLLDVIFQGKSKENFNKPFLKYKVPLRTKKVYHEILFPGDTTFQLEKDLNEMYMHVSGNPRIYLDNTFELIEVYNAKIKERLQRALAEMDDTL